VPPVSASIARIASRIPIPLASRRVPWLKLTRNTSAPLETAARKPLAGSNWPPIVSHDLWRYAGRRNGRPFCPLLFCPVTRIALKSWTCGHVEPISWTSNPPSAAKTRRPITRHSCTKRLSAGRLSSTLRRRGTLSTYTIAHRIDPLWFHDASVPNRAIAEMPSQRPSSAGYRGTQQEATKT